jgi:hypothetical protein
LVKEMTLEFDSTVALAEDQHAVARVKEALDKQKPFANASDDTELRLAQALLKGYLDKEAGYAIVEDAPWLFHNGGDVVRLLQSEPIPIKYLVPMLRR